MGLRRKSFAKEASGKALNELVSKKPAGNFVAKRPASVVLKKAAPAEVEEKEIASKAEISERGKNLKAMAIDDLMQLFDKLAEAGLNHEAKLRSEQLAEEGSPCVVLDEKKEKFVESAVTELWSRSVAAGVLASLSKPEQLIDELVKTVLCHEARVRSEQRAGQESTREVPVENTDEFVVPPLTELWARYVAAGVLGSVSKPEQLVDKLIEVVLSHEAKVRGEQQAGEESTREVVVEKTESFMAPSLAEVWARSVAAGVLGSLSQPERVQFKRQCRIRQRGSLSPWQRQAERRLAALLAR